MASSCHPRAHAHANAAAASWRRGAERTPRRIPQPPAELRPVAGLSAAWVERELGLPAGAWRRRRLFALRVSADGLAEIGIGRGDLLIVEPGQQANRDRLVVVGRGHYATLRRVVAENGGARRRVLVSPEPHSLPLATPVIPREVAGTVIGLIARRRCAGATTTRNAANDNRPAIKPSRRLNRQRLEATISAWDRWTAAATSSSKDHEARYRAMLAGRLRILGSCMEVATNAALYRALVQEANRVIGAMRQESARSRGPSLLALLPASSPPIAALRRDLSGNPHNAHNGPARSA